MKNFQPADKFFLVKSALGKRVIIARDKQHAAWYSVASTDGEYPAESILPLTEQNMEQLKLRNPKMRIENADDF